MKLILLLACIISTVLAQRGSFAGNRVIGVPDLATRFANGSTDGSPSDPNLQLSGRFGSNGNSSTMRIPVDARGDEDLVKRLETWPRENQPFWLVNAQQIERQRDPLGTRNNYPGSSQGQGSSYPTFGNRNGGDDIVQPGISVPNRNQNEEDGRLGPCHIPSNLTSFIFYAGGGELRKYIYDPVRDGWFRRTN